MGVETAKKATVLTQIVRRNNTGYSGLLLFSMAIC